MARFATNSALYSRDLERRTDTTHRWCFGRPDQQLPDHLSSSFFVEPEGLPMLPAMACMNMGMTLGSDPQEPSLLSWSWSTVSVQSAHLEDRLCA
jgi:hypothetical protein